MDNEAKYIIRLLYANNFNTAPGAPAAQLEHSNLIKLPVAADCKIAAQRAPCPIGEIPAFILSAHTELRVNAKR